MIFLLRVYDNKQLKTKPENFIKVITQNVILRMRLQYVSNEVLD